MENTQRENNRDFIIKEYELISARITTIYLTGLKIITIGLTIVASIMFYGIEKDVEAALFLLPVASFIPVLIALSMYTEEKCLGGYKKYLEEKINDLSGKKIVLWESEIAGKRHKDLAKFSLYIIYVCFVIFCVYLGLKEAWYKADIILFFFLLSLSLILTICSVIAACKFESSFRDTHDLCSKIERPNNNMPIN